MKYFKFKYLHLLLYENTSYSSGPSICLPCGPFCLVVSSSVNEQFVLLRLFHLKEVKKIPLAYSFTHLMTLQPFFLGPIGRTKSLDRESMS